MKGNNVGFTLLEVLIVVLVIGILTAVAVPQYQKAVLKSRFSSLMPTTKAIRDGNEVYYMEHGEYAPAAKSLDVSGQDEKYPDGTDVDVLDTDKYSYVLATRDNNFPLNYIVYQKHSSNFPDNIHCEASTPMAEEVCQGLGGKLLESGSLHDGYTTYILKGNASDGQMPTSLSKLVAACEQNANCTVSEQGDNTTLQECEGDLTGTNIKTCTNITYDEDGEQVGYEKTQQQCGQNITYKSVGYNEFIVGSSTIRKNGCIQRTYDEEDKQTGYVATVCDGGSLVNGECTGKWSDNSWQYKYIVDEAGLIISSQRKRCRTASEDGSSCIEWTSSGVASVQYYTYNKDGSLLQTSVAYCATYKPDGTCETYGSGKVAIAGSAKTCATFNADGTCATYDAKYTSERFGYTTAVMCEARRNNIDIYTGECL